MRCSALAATLLTALCAAASAPLGAQSAATDHTADTLEPPRDTATLAPVTVESKRRGAALARMRISAADFNPRRSSDALAVLIRYRPRMLGDVNLCHFPDRAAVEKIYVNGVRRDIPGSGTIPSRLRMPLPHDADATAAVLDVLERIPPEDIEEIHYVDCHDRTLPLKRQNALYVKLKDGKKYD